MKRVFHTQLIRGSSPQTAQIIRNKSVETKVYTTKRVRRSRQGCSERFLTTKRTIETGKI